MPKKKADKIYTAEEFALLNSSEHIEQSKFFTEIKYEISKHPHWDSIYAIPNGEIRPTKSFMKQGRMITYSPAGKKLKEEGCKSGVPDICIPFARGIYHGMYIEMKFGKNKPFKEQEEWIARLQRNGYYVVVCYSAREAMKELLSYESLQTNGK